MCNDYELAILLEEMNRMIDQAMGLQVQLPPAPPEQWNLPFAREVFPRLNGLILKPADPAAPFAAPLETSVAYWHLVPPFHQGTFKDWKWPCNNARSEEMTTKASFKDAVRKRRCIIPATAWFEWTGPKGKMTKHRVTPATGGMFFFAGLWSPSTDPELGRRDTYTMVMQGVAANDDMAPFHHRQPVLLDRESARTWLDLGADMSPGSEAFQAVIKPPPAGTLAFDPPEPKAA